MKGCFHSPISGAMCPNTRCLEVEYLGTYTLHLAFFTLHPDVPSPKSPVPFFLFFVMIQSCSQLRLKIIVIIDSFFLIPIFSVAPSTQFWIPINSASVMTFNNNHHLTCLVHLLSVYCLPIHPITISSVRAEILTISPAILSPAPKTSSTYYKVNKFYCWMHEFYWYLKMPALYFNYLCMSIS